jgi:predicted esterase
MGHATVIGPSQFVYLGKMLVALRWRSMLSRRDVFALLVSATMARCMTRGREEGEVAGIGESAEHEQGRIGARPGAVTGDGARGLQRLSSGSRGGMLYVPATYDARKAAPLVVVLHGAGGAGARAIGGLQEHADEHGMILVAPDSRGQTWDVIQGEIGPDVARIDSVSRGIFTRYAIDPARLCVSGFSDGASYALTLAVANGDLFTHCIAFSPGFLAPPVQSGKPRIFISHGTDDEVLPIDACSRRLVPRLERAGYEVTYREFEGPHTVPHDIADEAVDWFLTPR